MKRASASVLEVAVVSVLTLALAVQLLHLAAVAWRLSVDYWDGYEYLVNARVLAGHDVGRLAVGYQRIRPPLVPLLIVPLLRGYAPAGEGTSLRGPHLLAVALSALAILALHRLLRQAFSRTDALLGCMVLAMNPLFVHYAPFVMTDIPLMLCLTASAGAYLRARRSGRWLPHVGAALALGMAMLAKYTAVLGLVALGLFEISRLVVRGERGARLADVRPWAVVGGAVLLFYVVHAGVFARVAPGADTLGRLVDLFRTQGEAHALPNDPPWEFASELAATFSLPLVAVAVVGFAVAAAGRTDADLLCGTWFASWFALLTLLVAHKEARYAFPVVPPLVYFVVRGLGALRSLAGRIAPRVAGVVFAVAIVPLAVRPAVLAAGEHRRFDDPVYATRFLPDVAHWVLARADARRRVLFSNASGGLGFVYTMYPVNPVVLPYDEFYHFHHIGGPALSYLLDRPVEATAPVTVPPDGDLGPLVERFVASEVIVGSSGRFFDTTSAASAPEPPEPLTLTAVGRRTLRRVEGGATDRVTYEGDGEAPRRVTLARRPRGWAVADEDADGWQPYVRRADGPPVRLAAAAPDGPPEVLELIKVEQRQAAYR